MFGLKPACGGPAEICLLSLLLEEYFVTEVLTHQGEFELVFIIVTLTTLNKTMKRSFREFIAKLLI